MSDDVLSFTHYSITEYAKTYEAVYNCRCFGGLFVISKKF